MQAPDHETVVFPLVGTAQPLKRPQRLLATFSLASPKRHEVPPNGSYRRGVAINEGVFSGEDLVQNKLVQKTIITKNYEIAVWINNNAIANRVTQPIL
jgi:hypothetical protein